MQEIIELITKNYADAPPYIRLGENSEYRLVGNSDMANGNAEYYEGYGYYKLTAVNHTNTLQALMQFLTLVDAMDDADILDYEDKDIMTYLEFEFSKVLTAFFNKSDMVEYNQNITVEFLKNSKNLINEALYNFTLDQDDMPQAPYVKPSETLEGQQFSDPYIGIAYEIAKEYKLRPYDVITTWSTAELIVAYAKVANDNSLEAYLNYKQSQPKAPKQKQPKKQAFFFDEINDGISEEDEETNSAS